MSSKKIQVEVLVADDDEFVRQVLRETLEEAGFKVHLTKDGHEALAAVSEQFRLALLDLRMPGADGLQCLEYLKRTHPDLPVVIVTSSSEISDAVEAMKAGAYEYLTKPVNPDELLEVVHRALERAHLKRENRELRQAIGLPKMQSSFIGESAPTRALLGKMEKVCHLDSTVLITGESGVGKGLVARIMHQNSDRKTGPFVAVSCAALPRELVEAELFGHEKGAFTGASDRRPGRVEVADGGTLFLDEIGDMPLDLQPKVLTFLQDRYFQRVGGNKTITVDVRIIAATHQNLKALCSEKRFREDLYFRLNVLPLEIPSLRERRQDIALIAHYLLQKISIERGTSEYSLSPGALECLERYPWPGNVRELENVLERSTAFAEDTTLQVPDLPPELQPDSHPRQAEGPDLAGRSLQDVERIAILQTLKSCGGNKSKAARHLGISEKSIYNKMKRLGLSGGS